MALPGTAGGACHCERQPRAGPGALVPASESRGDSSISILALSFMWKLFALNFYHCNPQSLGWSLIRLSYKEL